MSADIFAGQPSDPDLLAEIYDLEHDQITEDHAFYRQLARRTRGAVLDLGCGSGRLFEPLLAGAQRVVGVDGSPALLRRARQRIRRNPLLAQAAAGGRLELVECDVRQLRRDDRFGLVVLVGVIPHLGGAEAVAGLLATCRRLLTRAGRLVIDDLGPAEMPAEDLPLSVDWRRQLRGRALVRYSQLMREESASGLTVAFSTLVERAQPDGTIARLPASYRLWYPSPEELERLVQRAGLAVELSYGSHDLEPLTRDSERRILVARRASQGERVAGRHPVAPTDIG
ncbi:MAG TPA: class I SAM-dependent methyltransferase [Candidatus Limnocylindria bacterium]|nr:class I SAM-dependent methyltransferase [Candidatus Limnocylindria bacterium]